MRKILLVILLLNVSEGLLAQKETAAHIGYNFGFVNTQHTFASTYKTPTLFATHNFDLGLHYNKMSIALNFSGSAEVENSSINTINILVGYKVLNKIHFILYPQIGIGVSEYKTVVSQNAFSQNIPSAISSGNFNALVLKNSNTQFVFQLNADHFPTPHSALCFNYKIGYAGSFKRTEWEADNTQTANPYKDSFSNIFASIGIKLFLGI